MAPNLLGQFLRHPSMGIIPRWSIPFRGEFLNFLTKSTLKSLLLPGGVLLAGVMALEFLGWMTLPLAALKFLYYCGLGGGMLLAWRFHSSRIFLSLCILFLAEEAIAVWGIGHAPVLLTATRALAILVPLDFILLSLMRERGFSAEAMAPVTLLVFVQTIVVAVLCRTAEAALPSPAHLRHVATNVPLPNYAIVVLTLTAAFLLIRFARIRKPVESAFFWALLAFFLSLHSSHDLRVATLYAATAACVLSTSIIESSYLLAYHDELTTLPSRRAFNDAVLRLQAPYSIAVVDIDHFKNFNDTYGHDTGDQVLRLVASSLARVTGGGRAYRCGGEEFTILFPGKSMSDVVDHLEQLRENIERSEFRTRGNDRRQMPRGPDRRNERTRRRSTKGQAIRDLAREPAPASLSVTVSIGVASSIRASSDAHSVVQAADKALYRAKANGRNRVETASAARKAGAKAAGIA